MNMVYLTIILSFFIYEDMLDEMSEKYSFYIVPHDKKDMSI
jgi:hypothetical protein